MLLQAHGWTLRLRSGQARETSLHLSFAGLHFAAASFSFAVFGLRFRGLAVVLVDEGVVKIYLDYATVLGHGAKHVVGHVAGVIGEGTRGRVRGNDGRFGDGNRVVERLVGNVRNIDQHAEAVHLEHDLLAAVGEAVVGLDFWIVDFAP